MHDVFISHASEDKESFVRALAVALVKRGVDVWYDEFSLKLGDSLRQSIDRGLAESRFGIVVLSPNFLGKGWPERELSGLTSREVKSGSEGIILPVWHEVGSDMVAMYSPPLADKIAVKSSDGIDVVCEKVVAVVRPDLAPSTYQESTSAAPRPLTVTPYTLAALTQFALTIDRAFEWAPHLRTIYASHRRLALSTIEQLAEALAHLPSERVVEGHYQRLLGRAVDPIGKVIYVPWVFLFGEQGSQAVETSVMGSTEYRRRKARQRIGLPPPPDEYVPDPMTQGPYLPPGWDGDAWSHPDGVGYFLRAWSKQTGRYAVGRGSKYQEARERLLYDVNHGNSRVVIRATEVGRA